MDYDPTNVALLRPYVRDPVNPATIGSHADGLCAELARLAYYAFPPQQARLAQALAALGLGSVALFEDRGSNTQAFAAIDAARTAYVVFRGSESENPIDAVNDSKFLPRPWVRGGKVHRGFAQAYDGANPVAVHDANGQPITAIDQRCIGMRAALSAWIAANASQRLVASGHSLGGALATLFASDHPEAELVTFGSPRVGNAEFAALFDPPSRKVKRFRDCNDLVSRVPPETFFLNYRHTKGLIYFGADGKKVEPTPSEAAMLAMGVVPAAQYLARYQPNTANALTRALADHAPINYVSAVLGIRS